MFRATTAMALVLACASSSPAQNYCLTTTLAGASFAAAGPDNLTISLAGACPGIMTLTWEGAPADRWGGLCFSYSLGRFVIPNPCQGTELGLGANGLRLVRSFWSGPEGRGEIRGRSTQDACGGYIQIIVVDGFPCPTSNVVQLPQ